MNSIPIKNRITTLLSRFRHEVECSTATGMTDINIESENLLRQLLLEIYGHKDLRNLNLSEGRDFPAIDLGDDEERIAYQITSTPGSRKIKDTLQKFVNYELYTKYDRLIIYILTEKQKTYQAKGLDEIIQGLFSFDIKTDVLDYQDLLNEISGYPVPKLRKIQEILEQQFGDESKFGHESICPLDWLAQVNDLWIEESATFKINREKLLNELLNFASGGHGVIIGGPGVGKSYLLKELHHSLDSSGTPHLLLPIDKLEDGTPETLRQELSYDGDLIKKLKSVPGSGQKSILLFDAFDAARDENTRRRFLGLIRRAIRELRESWNVVVTVRTYDAMKSQELLDLFGNPDDTEYQSEGILCRHFNIPSLGTDEVRQAFDQIPPLEAIYNRGSKEFKCLLTIPFNLWLLEKIIMSSQAPPDFSQIYSEVQLLGLFWQRRIKNTSNDLDRQSVLEQVARCMVEGRSLSVRREDVYEQANLVEPARQTAWNNLLSDEILANVSSTGQRVAFSHNILFDYAISILLIEDDSQQLEDFILEDESRPLFLRPSLTYFFTRLWYKAPDAFWNVFWHVFQSDHPAHLRLVVRLIPTSTIANETREIGQLTPLLDKLKRREGIAYEAMKWLLQSIRVLEIKRHPLWIDLFDRASAYPHTDSAWDLATLTCEIFDRANEAEDTTVMNTCGRVGRRLLEWVWRMREATANEWYNRFGSYRTVPLVAKAYGTNVEASRSLLGKVLKLTQEDNFPIDFLTLLTEHVDKIWAHDPEFAALTYCATFAHDESSDEKTGSMGTPVLPLTSTRRQDFSMCQYRLIKHYPKFLQSAPLVAIRTVIQYQNSIIGRASPYGHVRQGAWLEDPSKRFKFRGRNAYFVEDNSYMWDGRDHRDGPLEMADALFEFIAGLAESKDSLVDSILDVLRDEVWFAFFWKRLLKTAAQFPKVFASRLFELCIARPILIDSDALYGFGLFLQATASEFTPEQLLQIEEVILGIPSEDEQNREYLVNQRNQLLAQIPTRLLNTDESKRIREEMDHESRVSESHPLVSFSPVKLSKPYFEEEWIQDQGEDATTASENQELERFSGHLNKFHSDWLNGKPNEEATELIFPLLQEAYAAIERDSEADKGEINGLWHKLAACVAILGRVVHDPESPLFVFCREVLLHAAKHELPKPDSERELKLDFSSYSSCPRHDAAQGLLRLSACQSDSEMIDSIESLASDPSPSVRMVTAMELFMVYYTTPVAFWRIVDHRATHETNRVVQKYLYAPLTHVDWRIDENEDRTTRVMDKLLKRLGPPTENLEPSDPFILLLMRLAINRENPWALKTIEDTFFKDPIRFANALDHAVFQVMKDNVVPKNLETDDGRETAIRAIVWLGKVITVASGGIKELCAIPHKERTEETNKTLHDTYRVIEKVVMRLYFAAAHQRSGSEEPVEEISHELRCGFYDEVKPLMEQVIEFALDQDNGLMFAPMAYHFMQLLTSFLSCNPKEVLHLAARVARSSEQFGYNLDALAVQDVVKFVEIVLADHRSEVREGQALEDLLNLLDIFAKAGWSDALRLMWRLDEVFR